ncbi:ABC transporter substrate-binding protein [Arthrobacter sp. SA17]
MKHQAKIAAGTSLVAALTLAGCSTDSGSGSAAPATDGNVSGTLTMMYDSGYKAALEPVIAAFGKKYPDVKLDISYGGADLLSVVSTQAQANNLPDLFLTVPGPAGSGGFTVGTLASQNHLLDLSNESWAADVPETWKGAVGHEGKTFAYPGTLQGLGGIYNQTKLDELGVSAPKTWDEVLGLCKTAKDAGIYAYSQGLNDSAGPQMVYLALSGTLVYGPDPDLTDKQLAGKATFKDSGWKEIFTKYKTMNDAGCFGEGAMGRTRQQGAQEVAAGKAVGVVDVGAVLASVAQVGPNNKYTMQALPATNNAEDTYFPAAPGYTIAANANAKNPAAAKAFLQVLAEPANINKYSEGFASVPAIPNSEFKAPETLNAFNKSIADGKYTDYSNQGWTSPKVSQVAQEEVQQVLLGNHSTDQALEAMQKALVG